jgi:hypothetical protein
MTVQNALRKKSYGRGQHRKLNTANDAAAFINAIMLQRECFRAVSQCIKTTSSRNTLRLSAATNRLNFSRSGRTCPSSMQN